MWAQYDYIAGVSKGVVDSFGIVFSSLKNKAIVIENILSEKSIRKHAKEVVSEFDRSYINLLSVGRFTIAKNFDSIPEICRELIRQGLNVKWYLIGYGPDETVIKNKIQEHDMADRVIVLGKKRNPYPYIATCDFYIQPSRYEGKAVTVREAQLLGKPVIITAYPTSRSQLIDGYDGVIVPTDLQGCAQGIADVLRNEELSKRISENCLKEDYTNKGEINKLYSLMQ
jgi:glycosyltransferase involved in cell wall biosynthesis